MAKTFDIKDGFGTQDTVKWVNWDADVRVASGVAEVVPTTSFKHLRTNNTALDFTDSEMWCEVTRTAVGNGGIETTVTVLKDNNNFVGWLIRGSNLTARRRVSGTYTDVAVATYNATNHKFLRMRQTASSGVVTWETSTDGSTWNSFATWTSTITLTATYISLGSGYGGSESDFTPAKFDKVNSLTHQSIGPTGVASTIGIGQPEIAAAKIQPTGVASVTAIGIPRISSSWTISPTGVAPTSAVGQPNVVPLISPIGVGPTDGVGIPTVGNYIVPVGVAPTSIVGSPSLAPGPVSILVTGIGSTEGVGQPTLSQSWTIVGVPSESAVGTPRLQPYEARFRLVMPERIDRYVFKRGRAKSYVNIHVGLSVLGDDTGLREVETPDVDLIEASQYYWPGGHVNIDSRQYIRDLWLASGFEVEYLPGIVPVYVPPVIVIPPPVPPGWGLTEWGTGPWGE